MKVVWTDSSQSAENKRLIMSAAGWANIDQLCIDLLISTYSMQNIGYLSSEHLIPIAGYAEECDGSVPRLVRNAELFASDTLSNTLVLQLRAPPVPGSESAFASELVKFCTESLRVSSILVLSGVNAGWRNDEQLAIACPFRSLVLSSSAPELSKSVGSIALKFAHAVSVSDCRDVDPYAAPLLEQYDNRDAILESSPVVVNLAKACADGPSCPVEVVIMFGSEGQNASDAIAFSQCLVFHDVVPQKPVVCPSSWQHLFGGPPERSLFT